MGKKSKREKIRQLDDSDPFGIRFKLEENADEIFSDYLDNEFSESMVEEKESWENPGKNQSKKSSESSGKILEIDLHGLHLSEAIYSVDQFLRDAQARRSLPVVKCKIITGKGRHSGLGGGVLAGEIYEHVKKNFKKNIVHIDPAPMDSTIDGIPLRGSFLVTLKTNNSLK